MQPQLGIWKRFIRSLYVVDRCSLRWGSGRGFLEIYYGWTDAASSGDLEEVYKKFIWGGQMQPQLGIWKRLVEVYRVGQMQPQLVILKRFIITLLVVDRCSFSWGSARGLLDIY